MIQVNTELGTRRANFTCNSVIEMIENPLFSFHRSLPSLIFSISTKKQKKIVREKLQVFHSSCYHVAEVLFECGRAGLICILFRDLFFLKERHQLMQKLYLIY